MNRDPSQTQHGGASSKLDAIMNGASPSSVMSLTQPGMNYSRAGRSTAIRSTSELRMDSLPSNSIVRQTLQRQGGASSPAPPSTSSYQQQHASPAPGNHSNTSGNGSTLLFAAPSNINGSSSTTPPPASTPVLSTLDIAAYNQNRGNAEGAHPKGGGVGDGNTNNNAQSSSLEVPLDISSLGVNGAADIPPTQLSEAIVTSSPRLHPSVHHQQQHQYVLGKQTLFAGTLQTLLKKPVLPDEVVALDSTSDSAPAVQVPATTSALLQSGSNNNLSKQQRVKSGALLLSAGTSAFRSPTRESVNKDPGQKYPPVGHYHPQFTAVELPIAKPAVFPKSALASHHTTTTKAAMSLLEMTNQPAQRQNKHPSSQQSSHRNVVVNTPAVLNDTSAIMPIPRGAGGHGSTIADGTSPSSISYHTNNNNNANISGGGGGSMQYNDTMLTMDDTMMQPLDKRGGKPSATAVATTATTSQHHGSTRVAFGRGKDVIGRRDAARALSPAEDRAETERILKKEMDQWVPIKPFEKVIVTCSMGKEAGRKWGEGGPRSVSADLIYDQRIPACMTTSLMSHVPDFHKRTGRDVPNGGRRPASVGGDHSGKIPRTAAEIQSVQSPVSLEAYTANRYKRDPCITFMSKQPSREVTINDHIKTKLGQSTNRSELPENGDGKYSSSGMYGGVDMYDVSANSRAKRKLLETVNGGRSTMASDTSRLVGDLYRGRGTEASIKKVPTFGKMEGRKPQPLLPGQGLVYDLSYDTQDLHVPSTKLPDRVINKSSNGDITSSSSSCKKTNTYGAGGTFSTSHLPNSLDTAPVVQIDKLKRKLTHNISFDTFVSRDQREKVGRNAIHLTANVSAADVNASLQELAIPITLRSPMKGAVEFSKGTDRVSQNRLGYYGMAPQHSHSSKSGGGGGASSDKQHGGGDGSPSRKHHGGGGGVSAVGANDLVYTYEIDKFKSPLTKGSVEFGKMTSRETHKAAVHDRPSVK